MVLSPRYQNHPNSSAIVGQKSSWISTISRSHNKGRHETERCTHTNDCLCCQIGRTSWARLRKKKSKVQKPRRYIITPQKNRVTPDCNPEANPLFLPFRTQNFSPSTKIELTQCPNFPGAPLGRAVVVLREKSDF